MKKKIFLSFKSSCLRLSLLAFALAGVTGCVENIDDSNAVIKTGTLMSEYFEQHPEDFSHIKSIFDRVRFGEKENASGDSTSSISSALSARGNYTCFAPTNEAVENYVYELLGTNDLAQLTYEQAKFIAYSCVIDNGDEASYETPDFNAAGGTLGKTSFNHRVLNYEMNAEGDFVVEGSKIVVADIEVENGIIHQVDKVIAPSNDVIGELLLQAPNMRIMAKLFQVTGWAGKLIEESDRDYEQATRPDELFVAAGDLNAVPVIDRRQLGYTAFVETDSVLMAEWGLPEPEYDEVSEDITNWNDIYSVIAEKCAQAYPNSNDEDLTAANNPVNRFVAYHVIEGRVAYDKLVIHMNEFRYGYGSDGKAPQNATYPVNVWDYYETVGDYPELIKVTQVGYNSTGLHYKDIRLNRVAKYDNKLFNETTITDEGILISQFNYMGAEKLVNNGSNGFYYPIDKVLICDASTRRVLGSERMRFDMVTLLPEMASNLLRATGGGDHKYWAFPNGYFANIVKATEDTKCAYLHEAYCSRGHEHWSDYQGDEFIFGGLYDFTIKLPPVPQDGMYEFRMGVSTNTLRGMAQLYFGDNPDRLTPAGLPFDMRKSGSQDINVPWVSDVEGDDIANAEVDKNMHNAGYMKAPACFCPSSADGQTSIMNTIRSKDVALRRIVVTEDLKANTNYYLRIKSALVATDSQLFIDYFEYAPRSVYNGAEAEDIW